MSRNDEDFVLGHTGLSDEVLLAASGGLTPSVMFVATFEAKMENINMPMADAFPLIELEYPVVALNCNFGHKCLLGYESCLKLKPGKAGGTRKGQGDRTCFNSALEPVIELDRPDIPQTKLYYMKCFPSTGEVQVPGTLIPDMSDGTQAVDAWNSLLNGCGLGNAGPDGDPLPINVVSSRPNMINFKFRVKRASPRILIDLHCMADYFVVLEQCKILQEKPLDQAEADRILDLLPHGTVLLPPPLPVRETKPPIEDVKLTFKFGRVRVKIFQRGKVNILGADSFGVAEKIHGYLAGLIAANHDRFIRLQPRSDAERKARDGPPASASRLPGRLPAAGRGRPEVRPVLLVAPTPSYTLTDAEMAELLGAEPDGPLDDPVVNKVHGQNHKQAQKQPLQADAP